MSNSKRSIPTLTVRNAQRLAQVDAKALQAFGQQALRLCLRLPRARHSQLAALAEVSVLLISDRRIAALHRRFMNLPGPTDIITFQHGEIVISVETAARHARQFRTSALAEIRLYLVHGLLHLAGFDDATAAGARVMAAAQTRIVAKTTV